MLSWVGVGQSQSVIHLESNFKLAHHPTAGTDPAGEYQLPDEPGRLSFRVQSEVPAAEETGEIQPPRELSDYPSTWCSSCTPCPLCLWNRK
jgi:hypothetical protein